MDNGLQIQNVTFSYKKNTRALKNISVRFNRGTFWGIAGANGSGKTTFSYLLNGLIPHVIKGHLSGEVLIEGENSRIKSVSYFSKKIGMVFQNPDFSLFNLEVYDEIAFGLNNQGIKNQKEKINQALKAVNLSGFEKRDPQTLSFGEKQKVNLACVLALDPSYIILDEPSAMLDYQSSINLYDILKRLNNKGKTIIVIEHDTDLLFKYTSNLLVLNKGKASYVGDTKNIFSDKTILLDNGIKPLNYINKNSL